MKQDFDSQNVTLIDTDDAVLAEQEDDGDPREGAAMEAFTKESFANFRLCAAFSVGFRWLGGLCALAGVVSCVVLLVMKNINLALWLGGGGLVGGLLFGMGMPFVCMMLTLFREGRRLQKEQKAEEKENRKV